MHQLLEFFAAYPSLFYLTTLSVLSGFLLLVIVGDEGFQKKRRFEIAFLLAVAATLFAWRWPMFLWPNPLNIDEGYFTAGAMKATVDFAPWRGFDPTTSGPLNAYVLALPALFGARIDFFSTRAIGLCLILGATFALYFAARFMFGMRVGQLCVVPPVAFFSMTTLNDFVHCSSEHFPIFLTTVGLASAAYVAGAGASRRARLAAGGVGGLCLGSALFAKLQAAPIAAIIFLFLLAAFWATRRNPGANLRAEILATFLAAAAVPAAIVISTIVTGEWRYAIRSYLHFAFNYISIGEPVGLGFFFLTSGLLAAFFLSSAVVFLGGTAALLLRKKFTLRGTIICVCTLLLVGTAAFSIWTPHRPWAHYLLFSIFPVSALVAVIFGLTREVGLWGARHRLVAGSVVGIFVLPILSNVATSPHPYLKAHPFDASKGPTDAIKRHAPPGSRMTVWGWMPDYYVKSQTIPATRRVETAGAIGETPYRAELRSEYMADLEAAPPDIFVDAVAERTFYFRTPATQGMETFPALAFFVRRNYILKEKVDGVRIFVRK